MLAVHAISTMQGSDELFNHPRDAATVVALVRPGRVTVRLAFAGQLVVMPSGTMPSEIASPTPTKVALWIRLCKEATSITILPPATHIGTPSGARPTVRVTVNPLSALLSVALLMVKKANSFAWTKAHISSGSASYYGADARVRMRDRSAPSTGARGAHAIRTPARRFSAALPSLMPSEVAAVCVPEPWPLNAQRGCGVVAGPE